MPRNPAGAAETGFESMTAGKCERCDSPGMREQAEGFLCALCDSVASPTFSVVVPVYNSESSLPSLVERLTRTFSELGETWELLLIDDGSRDGSWQVIRELETKTPQLRAWRLMRNFGQHNAMMCGFQKCRGAYVVTLDDDLQNPPEEIPRLFAAQQADNYDVVFGYFETRRHSQFRNFTSRLSRLVVRAAIPDLDPHFSNFRLMTRAVVDELAKQCDDYIYTDGLISWITTHTSSIEVAHDERHSGESNYSLWKLTQYFLVALVTFTAVPLRAISIAGLASSAIALSIGLTYLGLRLAGQVSEPGFAAIIVAVFFLGGIQLFSLGIVAEYLGKIFLKQSHKPQYIIRESVH